jgi:hypothetical protein
MYIELRRNPIVRNRKDGVALLVIIDANVVVKDPLLREKKWDAAKTAIEALRLRLVLPEVARLEALGGHRRNHQQKIDGVKKILRKSTGAANSAARSLLEVYTNEIEQYEMQLNGRIAELGIELAPPPEADHVALTKRAIERSAPFDENGGGYRDTLLWLSAIELIEEPPFDNLVFLSDDSAFTKYQKELGAELAALTGAQLAVVRSVAALEFPNEYEAGSFELSAFDVNIDDVAIFINEMLPGLEISQWSPPGPDHAEVQRLGRIDLLTEGTQVRKRYGLDEYEVQVDAKVDIDATVIVIHDIDGDDVDFSQMSARWNLFVRWRGEVNSESVGFVGEGSIEVLRIEEPSKRRSRNPELSRSGF